MPKPTKKAIVQAALDRYGQTFSHEVGAKPEKNTPAELFQSLVVALLCSARISGRIAVTSAKALFDAGWTTPRKMADATWKQRVDVLNHAGYARYDESTSRMLGETCELLLSEYDGDLRKLREAADRDPAKIRKRLKAFKGIGDAGCDIFFREVQTAWPELYPHADRRVLAAAKKLDLGDDAATLKRRVDMEEFPRLAAALIRIDLDDAYDAIREAV